MSPATLVDLLRSRAERDTGYTFLAADGGTEHCSFAELDRRARAIGATLRQRGLAGERLLLLYPPGLEYVAGFFGCLYAGAVAVPVFPPNPARLDRTLPRVTAVAADARPAAVLCDRDTLPLAGLLAELPPDRWVATDGVAAGAAEEWRAPHAGPDAIALIQYTSGSTSAPKGVLLDHGNLLSNSALIQQAFGTTTGTRALSWLPLYHDMGLIGGLLQPLYADFPMLLMSPLTFLARPMSWLEAISRWRITTSGAPNFAYDLCVRKIDAAASADLDLSSWRVAFNGAEPIRPRTLDRFADAFAPYGFDRSAFLPCYGLAEATLIVTGKRWDEPVRVADVDRAALSRGLVRPAPDGAAPLRLVSSGRVVGDQTVRITDPDSGAPCPDGTVGEIRVAGPCVGRGYWRQPDATAGTFPDPAAGGHLRTGDLGFLRDGELFVTGRRKDLLIVRGRNVYPQDLELTAADADADVRPGCVAAFGVPAGDEEHAVVVAELAPAADPATAGAVADRVRAAVVAAHEIPVDRVVLIKAGTLPKTSSGKLRRTACRDGYLAGELEILGGSRAAPADLEAAANAARTDPDVLRGLPAGERAARIAEYLRARVAAYAGVAPEVVTADHRVDAAGLDSLASVELLHRIETDLEVDLPLDTLLGPRSIAALAKLIDDRLDLGPRAEPAAPPDGAGPPLTAPQRALWFLAELAPDARAYHLTRAFTVEPGAGGGLDTAALDRALCLLVARHEALRTVLPARDGQPATALTPPPEAMLQVVPVAGDRLEAALAAEAGRPFDLARGPLVRATLLVPDTGPAVLLLAAHHVALDLWSASVLMGELAAAYEAFTRGTPVDLPPPVQHAEAARRLAEVQRERREELGAYWRERLAGDLPVLDLPDPRPRPAVQSFRGAVLGRELPAALRGRVAELAAATGTTDFTVLLTALQVVLHRYTGERDIVVGAPVALRRHRASARAVGYLLNTVALRADLGGDPPLSTLLERNRHTVAEALAHQEHPFSAVVEELAAGRDPSRTPVFQVMIAYERVPGGDGIAALALDDPAGRISLGGVTLAARPLRRDTAAFDLTVRVAEVAGRLVTAWEYNTDVLDGRLVGQLADDFTGVLDRIAARADTRLAALALPSATAGLREWNATAAPVPERQRMHDLILSRAREVPTAVAVRAGDTELTYAELVQRATALAARLRARGVGPEARVAVFLPKSTEAVVAILATLVAGGAYVPLDPNAPDARTGLLLEEARPLVVVTAAALAGRLPRTGAAVVRVEEAEPSPPPAAEPHPAVRPDNLAYVMFTSGSTGRPKGVLVTHRNLVQSTHARLGYFPDRVRSFLLISSLAFDSSVAGLFWTLYEGGTLVLPDPAREQEPDHHRELLARHRVSHFESVPSLYATLLGRLRPGELPHLRSVVVAGEACPREVYERHRAVLPDAALVNEYGPTEGTVWCSAYRAAPGVDRPHLPIGRPIANASLYLLDRYGQPTPPGTTGEIAIGGAGVARGYHGQPALTAERFVPDPFGPPGARMYLTGDLARLLPDRELEFAGRVDRQVNIRGVRIELAEIEGVLLGSPAVAEAVVRPLRAGNGTTLLVAYLVAADRGVADRSDGIRRYAVERLPTAMVPAIFHWLPALPLTGHGKVDERALPGLDQLSAEPAGPDPAGGADPVAEVLAGMFAGLLDRPGFGAHDDFFAAGGHSLLVTQLVARIRATFGVELPARAVFTAPTPARLSEAVRRERAGAAETGGAPLTPVPRTGPAPLSYAQRRLWFVDRLVPGNVAYNIPVAVRLRGALDRAALQSSLDALVRRHEALRTTIELTADGPVQRVHPPAPMALEVREAPADLDAALAAAARIPFDLATGPLIRATLFPAAPDDHVLLLTMHHIVSDGWSLAVLTEEVAADYRAAVEGGADPLPDPPVQYADFAAWQRAHLSPERLQAQLGYWTARLADAPATRLPTDRPRPVVQGFAGATLPWHLDAETTAALRNTCTAVDGTLFMVLLSAFSLMLGRQSYSTDVVVGTPISGRTHVEIERLIGFFANTLALRVDLSGDPTFADLVGRVREASIDAYGNQAAPFELVVDALRPSRDLGRNPLFQVVFALQNAPRPAPRLSGLDLELLEVGTGTAKFDLTVSVWETGDGLRGTFEYATDLFDAGTVGGFQADFTGLLRTVAADPRRRLSELHRPAPAAPLSGPAAPTHSPEWTVAGAPDAIAVTAPDARLTAAELAERATLLAGVLRARGAGPGTAAGLRLDPSAAWVAGLLAIAGVGAACAPMAPAEDPQWIARLGPRLDALVVEAAGVQHTAPVDPDPVPPAVTGETACVCRDPAGTVVSDGRALRARVLALRHGLRLDAADRVLAWSPRDSEAALWEALMAVTAGAELVVPDPAEGLRPAVERLAPTVVVVRPDEAPALAGAGGPDLRVLCAGAEPPRPVDLPGRLYFVPALPLAPATTIWSRDATGQWCGQPLPGATLHVLDRYGRPVAADTPGQLHVRGPALAAGVVGGPAATAAGLIPDGQGGGRWHPTGLLVRHLPGGGLRWLGPVRPPSPLADLVETPYVPPRNGVERVVATVLTELLPHERIGVHDDFFELGGHSLLATQFINHLAAIFQVEVPIRTFFEEPTVAGVAAALTGLDGRPGQAERVAVIWERVRAGGGPA